MTITQIFSLMDGSVKVCLMGKGIEKIAISGTVEAIEAFVTDSLLNAAVVHIAHTPQGFKITADFA